MKSIIRIGILIAIIGAAVYIALQKGLIPHSQATNKTENNLNSISHTLQQQTETLTQRTKEVSQHVGNVLGTYIQSAENPAEQTNSPTPNSSDSEELSTSTNDQSSEPIHQKALEYTRYLYCQQVVRDYESDHPEAN